MNGRPHQRDESASGDGPGIRLNRQGTRESETYFGIPRKAAGASGKATWIRQGTPVAEMFSYDRLTWGHRGPIFRSDLQ